MKITRPLVARAGLVSLPVTALAPVVGCALTGYGSPWLALPAGSLAAAIGGTRTSDRTTPDTRRGVVVDPATTGDTSICVTDPAPQDAITVEFAWSDS